MVLSDSMHHLPSTDLAESLVVDEVGAVAVDKRAECKAVLEAKCAR